MAENNSNNSGGGKSGVSPWMIIGILVAIYLMVNNSAQGAALGGLLYQGSATGTAVAEMGGQMDTALAAMNGLTSDVGKIQAGVGDLAGIVGNLAKSVSGLSGTVSGLSGEVSDLTWKISDMEIRTNARFDGMENALEALSGGAVQFLQPAPATSNGTPPIPTPMPSQSNQQYAETNGGRTGGFLGAISSIISGN